MNTIESSRACCKIHNMTKRASSSTMQPHHGSLGRFILAYS